MKTCLIIGINSFTGSYLSETLKKQGYNIVGTVWSAGDMKASHISQTYKMNLLNYDNVSDVIARVQPDIVIHLAGISFVLNDTASQFYDVHIMGTRNVLSALVKHKVAVSKVILASSSQVYGPATNPSETTPTAPMNDYAVSKLAMEYMAKTWSDQLPIIIARPFNCIGVGQAKHFAIPKILSAFVSKNPELHLGRTDVKKDFLDVRVVAKCYLALVEEGQVGETYNLASGQSHSINYLIEKLSCISGFNVTLKRDERFVRKNEPDRIVGDNRKIMSLKMTLAHIPIEETLQWMYNYESWN